MSNYSAENEVPPSFPFKDHDLDLQDYYATLSNSELPVLFFEETGNVLFANKAFHAVYRYPDAFMQGSPCIGEIILPSDDDEGAPGSGKKMVDVFRPGLFCRASILDAEGQALPSLVSVQDMPRSTVSVATIYPCATGRAGPPGMAGEGVNRPAGNDESIPFEIFESYPHAVIVLSGVGCRYANAAARKVFGKNAFRTNKLPDIHLVHNDFSELMEELPMHGGAASPESRMIEDQLRVTKTRCIDVEVLLVPSQDECGDMLMVIRDITRKKHAESELLKRNSQLLMINEVMKVANSVDTLDEMLEEILDAVIREMNFDLGWVYLRDTDAKWATIVASSGVPDRFIETRMRQNVLDYPFNLVFFAMQQHYVDNLPNHPPGPIDSKMLEDIDALSYAGIPLISDSVVVGALYIGRRARYSFSTFEKKTLEMIGNEIGSTILRGMLQDRLEDAYSDASLYLDIMLHDIRNANAAILGYSRRLMDYVGEDAGRYADKVQWHTHHITDILNNVTTIRRITDESTELTPINLDALVSAEISQYTENEISFMRTGCTVWADSLLAVVFTNLIRNSIKYGGPDVRIWISSEETEHEVAITVEDDGPGITDEKKTQLFSLFQESTNERGGRGLGLHITRLLIRRYGGKIRPGDRIPGRPEKGLSIQFTLRLAEEGDADADADAEIL